MRTSAGQLPDARRFPGRVRARCASGAALLLVLLLLGGCARAGRAGPAREAGIGRGVPVRVENGSPAPLRVYLVEGGGEVPIGRIGALRTATFTLPPGTSGSVRLQVRPNTSRNDAERYLSEPFTVVTGQRIVWRLQGSPGVSNLPTVSTVSVLACDDDC